MTVVCGSGSAGPADRERRRLRRSVVSATVVCALLLALPLGAAEEVVVPVQLQAELLAKLVPYDRNFLPRAGSRVRTLIVLKPSDPASKRVSMGLKDALSRFTDIARLPHEEVLVNYEGAAALAKACREQRATILYIPEGLGGEVAEIGRALRGQDLLSVSGVAEDVARGVVLGFDLVSGKPKLVVNLEQAKQQNVSFKAEILKLVKVIR
jgi:hypothetical protein